MLGQTGLGSLGRVLLFQIMVGWLVLSQIRPDQGKIGSLGLGQMKAGQIEQVGFKLKYYARPDMLGLGYARMSILQVIAILLKATDKLFQYFF